MLAISGQGQGTTSVCRQKYMCMYARPTTHNSPALLQRKSQSSPSSLHSRDGGFLVMKAVSLSGFSWVRVSTVLLCRFPLSRIHKRLCRGIPNFDSRRKRKRSACGHRELLCKSHVCELDDCSTCRSLRRGGGARPWTLITEECYLCLSFKEYTNTSSAKAWSQTGYRILSTSGFWRQNKAPGAARHMRDTICSWTDFSPRLYFSKISRFLLAPTAGI